MSNYVYRCIPSMATAAPEAGNITMLATAWLYEQIAKQMAEGFEFHGSHDVRTFQPAGCGGAFFGKHNQLYTTTVLVFRRPA